MRLERITLAFLLLGGVAIAATLTSNGPSATTAAGGNATDVQYNDSGALAGSDNFVYSQSATVAGMSIIDPDSLAELDLTVGLQNKVSVSGLDDAGAQAFLFSNNVFDMYSGGNATVSLTALNGGTVTATTHKLTPVATPPFTCAAGTEGELYSDTSHALCWCNGTDWIKIAGAGACS